MFSKMRSSWLLFVLAALIALSSALNLEDLHIDGIHQYLHHDKRQRISGTGSTTEQTPEASAPTSTSEPSTSQDDPPDQTSTPPPSTTPPPASSSTSDKPSDTLSSSQEPPKTSDPPSSTPNSPSTPQSSPESTPPPSSESTRITAPITRSTPLLSTSTREFVTKYTTVSDGRSLEVTSTGTTTDIITTGTAVTTETPLPQNGDGPSGSGGLSSSKKSIIGGVVGGVGGAILLGGIALVCWRIWGRKKRVSEDDDDLVANTGAALGDKPHSANTNTPFQSNLEQYHNPGGRPNAAANF